MQRSATYDRKNFQILFIFFQNISEYRKIFALLDQHRVEDHVWDTFYRILAFSTNIRRIPSLNIFSNLARRNPQSYLNREIQKSSAIWINYGKKEKDSKISVVVTC